MTWDTFYGNVANSRVVAVLYRTDDPAPVASNAALSYTSGVFTLGATLNGAGSINTRKYGYIFTCLVGARSGSAEGPEDHLAPLQCYVR